MGDDYKHSEAKIKDNKDYTSDITVEEITEIDLRVYQIRYGNGNILRVFNPIEVLFEPLKP